MNGEIHRLVKEIKERLLELEYLIYLEEGELKFFNGADVETIGERVRDSQ